MGLAASNGRIIFLVQRKSDIEFQIQTINQRRQTLSKQASDLAKSYANAMYQNSDPTTIDPNGAALPGFIVADPSGAVVPQVGITTTNGSIYEAQMAQVQAIDKQLELRQTDLNTQHKEVETEVDAVQKVIDKNIEKGFKTLG